LSGIPYWYSLHKRLNPGGSLIAGVGLFLFCATALSGCGAAQDGATADQRRGAAPDTVQVPQKVAQLVDIRNEPVAERLMAVDLHVTGQIKPEVGKEVNVNTRFSGRVTEVRVTPGQFVKAREVLAKVDSQQISELQAELIEAKSKLAIAEAQEERERQIYEEQLLRPKTLIQARTHYDETKVQLELAESEFKRQEGLYHEKISSAKDYLTAKANLAKAKAAYAQALVDLQREERLYANKAMMKRDYQLAQAETARARQHLNTLVQRLQFLGMAPHMVRQVENEGKIIAEVPIVAPASGVVTHQGTAVGEVITPDENVFTITDLAAVVATADIPEVDLPRVRPGSRVRVKIASHPNKVFEGVVSYISEHVNPETRTVSIRARLPNPDRLLKSNMFAECDIEGEPAMVLACPKSAVQERDGKRVVYVLTQEGYRERPIEVGSENEQYYQVMAGLSVGERVATQGSLMLKTELTYRH
jgi:cobalt-zinc-cadmium efflux system membrane fusion protein